MKKNLSEILQSADAETLEGLFDSVKTKENPTQNTKKKPKNNQPIFFRVVAVAASFALLISGAIALTFLLNREKFNRPSSLEPSTDLRKEIDTSLAALARSENVDRIIWSADAEPPYISASSTPLEELVEWNEILVTKEFYDRLAIASGSDLFAVTARPKSTVVLDFNDFVYEGKTGKELDDETNTALSLYETIQLLKRYVLLSDEEKEQNEWMIRTIVGAYGTAFLETYKTDEGFDLGLISDDSMRAETDFHIAQSKRDAAQTVFATSAFPRLFVFWDYLGIPVYSGYHKATDQHYYLAVITKAQLALLKENYTTVEKPYGEFDFENCYLSMVPYPEEDIAYAINKYATNPTTPVPPAPDESDQVPATIQE